MNKKELIKAAAAKSGQPQIQTAQVLSAILETISETLLKEDSVMLHSFGTFTVKERAARKGINPMTKKPLDIPAKKVIRFKAYQKL